MRLIITIVFTLIILSHSDAQEWSQVMKLVASDVAAEDTYGQSVSVSGNYAIIGAYLEDDDATGGNPMAGAGSAYLLERDEDGKWNEVQKIVSSDRTAGDKFGFSVAISGNYAVIGATGEDHDLNGGGLAFDSGSAYIFKREENGTWNEVQKIVASDRAGADLFGYSVSISGDYVAIGAYSEDEDASGGDRKSLAGSAYIFMKDGSGNWNQTQKIVASDREPGDRFGFSVCIDNKRLIAGAYFEDHDASGGNTVDEAGSAYIFERNDSESWEEVQKITAPQRFEDDNFGRAVAISGDYAVAGAFMEDENASEGGTMVDAGSAYIYERDGGGNWSFVQKAVASDRGAGDNFGVSVSISNNIAIIGSWLESNGTGAAYFFERNDGGVWNEAQKIVAADKEAGDRFGVSVSISNGFTIVGAHFKADQGAAYAFESSEISATRFNIFEALLKTYPNPTEGNVTIDLNETYAGVRLSVYNVSGQFLLNQNFGTTDQISFNIEGASGIYVVEVHTETGKSAILKVVKE